MEAWKAKGNSVALAAMGLVTTLVGMALVESASAHAAAGALAGFAQTFGEFATIAGAALLIGAIFAYVLARRGPAREPAREPGFDPYP